MIRDFEAARGHNRHDVDVVIVGTGPGGSAVARVLARAGRSVMLLEEGPAKTRFRPNLAQVNRFHMQEGGAMIAQGDGFMPIAAGRGVGGGSLVNSALSFRAPSTVLDSWTDVIGDDRFCANNLAPIYDRIGERIEVATTPERIAGENNLLIARGARALGLRGGLAPRNTPRCVGCGFCNYGCPVGGKNSMDRTLLVDARGSGAVIQADTKVHSILVEGDRAVGVVGTVRDPDTRKEVGTIEVRATAVFICAGGIGTPRLLHHAGLAERLGPVGEGLHVHPGNLVLGACDHDVHMWSGATQGAYFESDDHPGVLPHTATLPPGALLLMFGRVGHDAKADLQRLRKMAGCVVMISDKGSGTVGAYADGTAKISYYFDAGDIQRIKDGMVLTGRVLLAGGARSLLAPVHGLGEHDNIESFEAALRDKTIADFTLYAAHPMSSCRMGREGRSVIGPTGETHGLSGLYIADSSIFPTSLGVNPQFTTMVLATAIAEHLVDAEG